MAAQAPTKKFHKTTYPSLDPTRPEINAKGKTVVVTGGGTGIGAETALYFARAGAQRIGILGRRAEPLLDTKAKIEAQHPATEVIAISADITKTDEIEGAFEKIAGGGKIHVLINNAAVLGKMGTVASLSTDDWFWGIETNVRGTYNVTRAFFAHCTPDAVLIEVNSAAAHITVGPGVSVYNVSKTATARLYSSLVAEHPDLSFFSIQPGVVDTAMNRETGYVQKKESGELEFEGDGASLLDGYDDASLPASFMVWLASPEGSFLKGKFLWANWDVDELKAQADKIKNSQLLSIALVGWPFSGGNV